LDGSVADPVPVSVLLITVHVESSSRRSSISTIDV
jgi:hypothetical protein